MVSKEALDANRTNPCRRDDKAKRLPKTPPPESAVWGGSTPMFSGRGQIPLWVVVPRRILAPFLWVSGEGDIKGGKFSPHEMRRGHGVGWLGINQASNWTLLRREGGRGGISFSFSCLGNTRGK